MLKNNKPINICWQFGESKKGDEQEKNEVRLRDISFNDPNKNKFPVNERIIGSSNMIEQTPGY
jgi:hypothetical protein